MEFFSGKRAVISCTIQDQADKKDRVVTAASICEIQFPLRKMALSACAHVVNRKPG